MKNPIAIKNEALDILGKGLMVAGATMGAYRIADGAYRLYCGNKRGPSMVTTMGLAALATFATGAYIYTNNKIQDEIGMLSECVEDLQISTLEAKG